VDIRHSFNQSINQKLVSERWGKAIEKIREHLRGLLEGIKLNFHANEHRIWPGIGWRVWV